MVHRLRIAASAAALAGGVALVLGGCSQSSSLRASSTSQIVVAASTATVATVPSTTTSTTAVAASATTTQPTTTSAATTVPPPTTTTAPPPTSAAPLTVPATLPTPDDAPTDPNAREPTVQIGSIEIPRINVSKAMYEGVSLTTLNQGPGHWPGTAMPGQVGNVVVGGHRVSHDKPFRHIDQLQPGDDVFFVTDAGRFDYKVVSSEVVTPDATWIVDQTPEATATLFACTPPGSTTHRLVVHLALSQ